MYRRARSRVRSPVSQLYTVMYNYEAGAQDLFRDPEKGVTNEITFFFDDNVKKKLFLFIYFFV